MPGNTAGVLSVYNLDSRAGMVLCGFAEQLEFSFKRQKRRFGPVRGKSRILGRFLETAKAVADYTLKTARPTESRMGHRGARAGVARGIQGAPRRSVQRH